MSQDLNTSCNGYLSIETLGPFLEKLIGADEESHQKKIHELDEDSSGRVSQNEFLVYYNVGKEKFKYDPPSIGYQAFSKFDNVSDSSLFHSELSEP